MTPVFDLRSDTVTKPTPGMRAAMAAADVGDDVFGEDPTTRALEEQVAALLGKEAALFVPTGTMGNQIALLLHTQRGDEVIVGQGAHVSNFESGAGAAWSGVQFVEAGQGGLFRDEDVRALVRPRSDMYPRTSLVCVENTHNRGGGRIFPLPAVKALAAEARRHQLGLHLDGSRLWNAAVATGTPEADLAAPFDTVNVCFSKGLGAPAGSALAGSRDHIQRARRWRKMLGGGMRQSGVLAAAALYALRHHRGRLMEDHEAATRLAAALARSPSVVIDAAAVETNILVVKMTVARAHEAVGTAQEAGLLCFAIAPDTLRLVTHLDFPLASAGAAAAALIGAIEAATAAS